MLKRFCDKCENEISLNGCKIFYGFNPMAPKEQEVCDKCFNELEEKKKVYNEAIRKLQDKFSEEFKKIDKEILGIEPGQVL